MNILTVVGARPQFIKASAVSAAIARRGYIHERIVHTGQHFDDAMSHVFFAELGLAKPTWNLGLGGGPHGAMTGGMLAAIEDLLLAERPDAVLVYGDTNSTLAGALAAAKLRIPVAHVEAGLRSFNREMPEEVNRVLTDHVSAWLFAPTDEAVRNLAREGIAGAQVRVVGDVMYDVALLHGERARERLPALLAGLDVQPGGFVLTTVHRAENTDDPNRLAAIVGGLREVAEQHPVIWPLHPRTRNALDGTGLLVGAPQGLRIVPPVGYLDMVALEMSAALVATDSGGVQKEAFFHGVPCVTLRGETEWVETVDLGWNRLVLPETAAAVRDGILAAIGRRGGAATPYGEGAAAELIVSAMA